MPRAAKDKSPSRSKADTSTANLGFEAKLWLAADKLRNNMDAAEPSETDSAQHCLEGERAIACRSSSR